jgi:hypothetical protein
VVVRVVTSAEARPYLVVADIVITLVHAFPVRPVRERVRDVLDIWDSVHEGPNRPASVTKGNAIQIN